MEVEQEKEEVTKEDVGEVEDRVDRFYNSIKSRMMVGEVISNIENNAHFTFDFLMLLVLAGVIAFLGLVESSSVTLVASMLISPLMGPILAGIFGTVIGDPKLRNLGIWNELMSLGICIIVGFVLGLIVCPWIEVRVQSLRSSSCNILTLGKHLNYGGSAKSNLIPQAYGATEWPTREMRSRGDLRRCVRMIFFNRMIVTTINNNNNNIRMVVTTIVQR